MKTRGFLMSAVSLFTAAAMTITASAQLPFLPSGLPAPADEVEADEAASTITLFRSKDETGSYTSAGSTEALYVDEVLHYIAFISSASAYETVNISVSNNCIGSSETSIVTDADGCIRTDITANTLGEATLTFSLASDGNVKKSVNIKVVRPDDIKSMRLLEGTMQKDYYVGDSLEWGTAHLALERYNGTTDYITVKDNDDVAVLGYDEDVVGVQTVSVVYEGFIVTVEVTVEAVAVTRLEVMTDPDKMTYYVGEKLDLEGCTLRATYNNRSTETVEPDDPDLRVSGFSSSAAGTSTVMFTYGGKNTSIEVTIVEKTVTSVFISAQPKSSYFTGESLDLTDGKLDVTYNLGDTETIPMTTNGSVTRGITVSGFSSAAAGTYVVKVSYGGKSDTFEVTVINVAVTRLSWASEPVKTDYYIGDALDLTGGVLVATYNNGDRRTITLPDSSVTVSGFDSTTTGDRRVWVNYGGASEHFDITVSNLTVEALEVYTEPAKKVYFLGETSLDLTGGVLLVTYSNRTTKQIPMTDPNVTASGFSTAAETASCTITLAYKSRYATFDIEVKRLAMTGLTIVSLPYKTQYNIGEALDLTGGKLRAYYNNNTSAEVDMNSADVTVTGFDSSIAGSKLLTAWFTGESVTFSVNVGSGIEPVNVTGISINTTPKTNYSVGEALDVTGGTIKVTYSSGTPQIIPMTADMISGFSTATTGTKTLTVTYANKTANYTITVGEASILSIEMETLPKTVYYKGESLDVAGGSIRVNYTGENYEIVQLTAAMVSGFSTAISGRKTLNVSYNSKSTTYPIEVKDEEVTAISVNTLPRKTDYAFGETLDVSGGKLNVEYSSGKTETVDMSQATVTGYDPTVSGTQTLTVKYGGKTTTFDVTVDAKGAQGIEVTRDPDKVNYYFGETLDLTGGILTVTYEDSSKANIPLTDENIEVTGFDAAVEGVNLLAVNYFGQVTTLAVTVYEKKAVSLSVAKYPDKMSYSLGEELDLTGGIVTATYIYNDTERIPMTDERVSASALNTSTAGTKRITLTFDDKSVSFTVAVTDETVTSVSIYKAPNKTIYYLGEKADYTGGQLLVKYNGGASEKYVDMTDPLVLVGGFDTSTTGPKVLTFTYGGRSAMYTITVASDTVTTLTVYEMPKKITYNIGDNLDLTGGVLKVEYNNGTRTDYISMLAAGVTSSGFSSQTAGIRRITLTFSGMTAYFNVTVRPLDKVVMKGHGYDSLYEALDVIAAEVAGIRADRSYTIQVNDDLYETKTLEFAKVPITINGSGNKDIVVKSSSLTAKGSLALNNVKFVTTRDKSVNLTVKGDFTGSSTETGNITATGSVVLEDCDVFGRISAGGNLTLDGSEVSESVTAKGTLKIVDSAISKNATVSAITGTSEISRSKIEGKTTCSSDLTVKSYSELGALTAKRLLNMSDSTAGSVTVSNKSGITVFDSCEIAKLTASNPVSITNTTVEGALKTSQLLSVSGRVMVKGAVTAQGLASLANGSMLSYTSLSVTKTGFSGTRSLTLRVVDKYGSPITLSPTSRTLNVVAKTYKGPFLSSLLTYSSDNYKGPAFLAVKGTKLIIK